MLIASAAGIVDDAGAPVLADRRVGAVVRSKGGGAFAVVDSSTVHELVDNVWHERAQLGIEITCLAVEPDGALLIGTRGAYIWRLGASGQLDALTSFDTAPSRDHWYTPWGGPPDTRSIAVAADGAIYVNVHVGGILRSTDGGSSWSPTIDIHSDVHEVLCPDPTRPELVVAATAVGVAETRDAGATWHIDDSGMHASYCRAVAVAGDTLLLSASTGPDGGRSRLYRRSLDGDADFEVCEGLPEDLGGNVDTGWIAGSSDGRAAFVAEDGRLFISGDGGGSWSQSLTVVERPAWLTF